MIQTSAFAAQTNRHNTLELYLGSMYCFDFVSYIAKYVFSLTPEALFWKLCNSVIMYIPDIATSWREHLKINQEWQVHCWTK